MRLWMDRVTMRGRLHGRLLKVLIAVAALACVAAILQFSVLRIGDDSDRLDLGTDDRAVPGFSADPESAVEGTAQDSPSGAESASASEDASSSPEVDPETGLPETSGAAGSSGAEPTTEAAPAAMQCTATLTLDNEWSSSVSVKVTVANTGSEPVEGWEVVIDVEHLSVASTWGLSHVEGDRYGDVWFNGSLDPGKSVGPSFTADVEGEFALPATVPCTPEG